ncbi:hypothetical protein WICPIJ_004833 [Wickerhamomyces pijperi]|uniref:Uncharacterized protein n=1 Tax=Wickerhamomyces pijperi TaxID=599730 RepID=A0A9P8Q745_WICPI|nr:hypothetical protein WICPIJ_004833 [Wickerhamomyces pijperi]
MFISNIFFWNNKIHDDTDNTTNSTKENQSLTIVAPRPNTREHVKTNLSLLVNLQREIMDKEAAQTDVNKKVVIPPRTGFGIDKIAPENLPKIPMIIKIAQHQ